MKMTKKLMAALLALAMVMTIAVTVAIPASAADYWNGTDIATGYAGGTGTEADPFKISTAAQLAFLATVDETASSQGKFYKLTNDIALGDFQWTPIGPNSSTAFQGTFDGDGHTISGLAYTPTGKNDEAGLFGHTIGAVIKNVTVTGSKISGRYAGAIAGRAFGDTQIINCHGKIDWIDGVCIGGIAGRLAKADGLIMYCTSESTIKQTTFITDADHFVGGIAGVLIGTMRYCTNKGDVSGLYEDSTQITKSYRFGGLVGTLGGSDGIGNVEYCVNTGNITVAVTEHVNAAKAFAGGLVAYANKAGSTITSSFNVGTVTATTAVGGTELSAGNYGTLIGSLAKSTTLTNVYTNADPTFGANGATEDASKVKVLTVAEMQGANALKNMELGSTIGNVLDAEVEKVVSSLNYKGSEIEAFANYTDGKTIKEYAIAKVREQLSLTEGADIWVTADGKYPEIGSLDAINAVADVTANAAALAEAVFAELHEKYKNDPANTTAEDTTEETPADTTEPVQQTTAGDQNTTAAPNNNTATAAAEEGGCGGFVGFAAIFVAVVASLSCAIIIKKN